MPEIQDCHTAIVVTHCAEELLTHIRICVHKSMAVAYKWLNLFCRLNLEHQWGDFLVNQFSSECELSLKNTSSALIWVDVVIRTSVLGLNQIKKRRIDNWSQVFEDKIKEPSNFNSFSNWHQQQPLQGGRKLIIFIFYWKKKHIETNLHVMASVKTID